VKFPHPVLIGDTLHAVTKVISKRESKSRSNAGIVIFDQRAYNQRDEEVASCRRAALMMKRLAQGVPPGSGPRT
jgi:acyl dehydratase